MKVHWLALLIIIGAAFSVPTVSAKIIEERNGYIVTTGTDTFRMMDISRMSSSSISQGQTQWYTTAVSPLNTAFYSDLNWANPSNSLTLTLVVPTTQFGPYSDASDGTVDGRITLRITKSSGLPAGTWQSAVYGSSVAGVQSYTYTAYPA
jgi:hypothetical protein